jgi:hypothetical protein
LYIFCPQNYSVVLCVNGGAKILIKKLSPAKAERKQVVLDIRGSDFGNFDNLNGIEKFPKTEIHVNLVLMNNCHKGLFLPISLAIENQ